MKVMIMTDLEGVSGVDSIDMMDRDNPSNMIARKRLTADSNAAIEGAFAGGATKVYIRDGHGGSNSFLLDKINKKATVIKGSTKKVLDETFHCVMQIGAHAMAGTINGFLDHTQSSRSWFNYKVNGRKTGEIGQFAILAGHYNVPCVMVAGDEAACVEAKQFLGNIETAVVKYGIGRNRAKLIDLNKAEKLIYNAAKKSLSIAEKIKPYRPKLPMDIELELYRTDMCENRLKNGTWERIDARTVRKTLNSHGDIG